jgi:hypothetical protein
MHEINQIARDASIFRGLFTLNDEELLVTTIHAQERNGISGVVTRVNLESGKSTSIRVKRDEMPIFARNNKVYFVDLESEPIVIRIQNISDFWRN